jgi:predicted nucleotide-binding protein
MASARAEVVEIPAGADRRAASKRTYVSQGDVPKVTLEEALKIPQCLQDEFAGRATPPHQVAMALNLPTRGNVWAGLCGASIAYGLTEGGMNAAAISLTDLGRSIVAPIEEGQEADGLVKAALKPKIPRLFFERYNRNRFPQEKNGRNVLIEFGTPHDRANDVLSVIKRNGEFVGIVHMTATGLIVALDTPQPPTPTTGGPRLQEVNPPPESDAPKDTTTTEATDTVAPIIAPAPTNNKVFVTHGKNRDIVAQLKELLTFGKFDPVIAVEHETTAIPVPVKVLDDMRQCFAGIIHVASEEEVIDSSGNKRHILNENVLVEIGAALALFGKNVILLVQKGVRLPSNLQGLYRCEYEGSGLDYDATMKLLRTFNEFRNPGVAA